MRPESTLLDSRPLLLGKVERDAIVAFLKSLTDERVRTDRAPFDHPELIVPNGHPGDADAAREEVRALVIVGDAADVEAWHQQVADALEGDDPALLVRARRALRWRRQQGAALQAPSVQHDADFRRGRARR